MVESLSSEPILRTPRLHLEPSRVEMLEGMWRAMESSFAELGPWMPWAIEPSRDKTREFLEGARESWASGKAHHFVVFIDEEVCGACSLDDVNRVGRSAAMGYWMRSDLCGRGLMTEAATAVVDFGFRNLDLHRIELHAGTENIGSIRVAEKLGFQREGTLRDAGLGVHGYYDCYVYGLLSTDPRLSVEGDDYIR